MAIEIKVPAAGESITSANVGRWHVANGASVRKGDVLVTLETDKVSNELEAVADGVLTIAVGEGNEVAIGTIIGSLEEVAAAGVASPAVPVEVAEVTTPSTEARVLDIKVPPAGESITTASVSRWHKADGAQVVKGDVLVTLDTDKVSNDLEAPESGLLSIMAAEGTEVGIGAVVARLTVGAVVGGMTAAPTAAPLVVAESAPRAVAAPAPVVAVEVQTPAAPVVPKIVVPELVKTAADAPVASSDGRVTRKKMSMLRRKIANHLVSAQQTAAILTTFNEVDMTAIMELRKSVQDDFMKKYQVKLGFMSFFVKAVVQALKDVPQINAAIDGNDVLQNHFYDIGVAVGTEKGLVVPVLRDCEKKSFAQLEQDILAYAAKAREGKISLDDLQGGVFTISNGGVYGSLLSTPILNPPQSGILGMHTIQQRPVAIAGKVEIRPMMYLALSYDHRLVDGKEAVTFLIRIKECLENPTRLLLEM